jgi:hypothetical protein
MGLRKNTYGSLVGKPEWKRPLIIPNCRWKVNIKLNIKEIVAYEEVD